MNFGADPVRPFDREIDALELMDVDELALTILPFIGADATSLNNVLRGLESRISQAGLSRAVTLQRRLAEAWNWLRTEGFIVPHWDHDGWEQVSRSGEQVTPSALIEMRSLRLLRHAQLTDALTEKVLPIFRRGLYSAAVFQAMLVVEVTVRESADLADLDGVDLMRKAFRPGGPLADPSVPTGDQEARMALFWGAIGTYRNEAGHHNLAFEDPQEAAEAVLFANALLRLVARLRASATASTLDRRRPRPNAQGWIGWEGADDARLRILFAVTP